MIRQFELVERVKSYDPGADEDTLNRAYVYTMKAHGGQTRASGDPYFSHPIEVAGILTEMKLDSASIVTALLHDTVEDTATTVQQIAERFGDEVARGVAALSKDPAVGDKPAQMRDSLARIRACPREVWMVKLADRVHNLRSPPHYWKPEKIEAYREEARLIHATLGEACPVLGARLLARIETYPQ